MREPTYLACRPGLGTGILGALLGASSRSLMPRLITDRTALTMCHPSFRAQVTIDAHKIVQSARRLLAHSAILAFMMEAGLNRQRLEFAAADLTKCCERVVAEIKATSTTQRVCAACVASFLSSIPMRITP